MSDPTDLEYTVYLACTAETAWEAITNAEIVSKYYPCPMLTTELVTGGDIVYGTADDSIMDRTSPCVADNQNCHRRSAPRTGSQGCPVAASARTGTQAKSEDVRGTKVHR